MLCPIGDCIQQPEASPVVATSILEERLKAHYRVNSGSAAAPTLLYRTLLR